MMSFRETSLLLRYIKSLSKGGPTGVKCERKIFEDRKCRGVKLHPSSHHYLPLHSPVTALPDTKCLLNRHLIPPNEIESPFLFASWVGFNSNWMGSTTLLNFSSAKKGRRYKRKTCEFNVNLLRGSWPWIHRKILEGWRLLNSCLYHPFADLSKMDCNA